MAAEHRLARLFRLGIRQARYARRTETKFQLYRAVTVVNLTLLADKLGLHGDLGPDFPCSTLPPVLTTSPAPIIATIQCVSGFALLRHRCT